jgi:hypothetical protein
MRGHRYQRLFYLDVADEDEEAATKGAPVADSDMPVISLLTMTSMWKA